MQQPISKIITLDDIKKSLSQYRTYLKGHNIDYKEMELEKIEKIKAMGLSPEDEKRNIGNVKDIYLNSEKAIVKQMLMTFFANELKESQIKLEFVFEWVNDNIDNIEKEFTLGFDKEDKLELGFEVLKSLFTVLSEYTTFNYNEKEKKLFEKVQKERKEEAKKVLKENRSFHRGTPVLDGE